MWSLITFLFLLLKIINTTAHSVTIMNDSQLGDKQGAVHTWLKLNRPVGIDTSLNYYFSFESNVGAGFILLGMDVPGKCTNINHIANRVAGESLTISITENQTSKHD